MAEAVIPLWKKYVPLDRQGRRDWKAITDDHLLAFGVSVVEAKGISGRRELAKADLGVYQALRRRGFLDQVFSSIEIHNSNKSVTEIIDALKEFEK